MPIMSASISTEGPRHRATYDGQQDQTDPFLRQAWVRFDHPVDRADQLPEQRSFISLTLVTLFDAGLGHSQTRP
jgi:hypothetical protein